MKQQFLFDICDVDSRRNIIENIGTSSEGVLPRSIILIFVYVAIDFKIQLVIN